MAKYHKCPNCGNSEEGTDIEKCKECGHIGCYTSGIIFDSGCIGDHYKCPNCGDKGGIFSSWWTTLGTIEENN